MSNVKLSEKAQQLLDAQVAFAIDQVAPENIESLLKTNLNQAMDRARKLTLSEAVTPESIKKTAIKYASDMPIGPGIPELVGEIAAEIYNHEIFDTHQVSDVMSKQDFQEFLEKAAEMDELRNQVISEIVSNPLYASLMSDLLYHGISEYIAENPMAKKIPGAKSMMKLGKSVMDKASPNLEGTLKKYVASNIRATLKESERFLNKNLTNEKIVEIGMDTYSDIEDAKLGSFRKFMKADDINDAFVALFEYWKNLRKTDFYKTAIESGVDFFFKKYGDTSLYEILEDIGVTEEMLIDDAMTFAPMVIENLQSKGLLEDLIRQNLLPFYESDILKQILGE
ncbi:MAG: hypothetical protein MI976_31155 [Pseudomonadales bacterium]|nr:hypothetical protein [Pseudomonadales bacterium]